MLFAVDQEPDIMPPDTQAPARNCGSTQPILPSLRR
jgi:hypothetical protein